MHQHPKYTHSKPITNSNPTRILRTFAKTGYNIFHVIGYRHKALYSHCTKVSAKLMRMACVYCGPLEKRPGLSPKVFPLIFSSRHCLYIAPSTKHSSLLMLVLPPPCGITHHGKSIPVLVLFYFPILGRCIWSIINLRFLSPWPAPCRRVPPSTFYLLLSGGSVAKYFTGYWIECLISALALPHSLPGDGKLWDGVALFRTNYLHIKRNVSYPPTATKALHSTTKGIVYFRICRGECQEKIYK